MISHQVSGMPVIDGDGKLVGMITESDFLRRAEMQTEAPQRRWLELLLGPASVADEYSRSHGRTVKEVMSANVVTAGREAPLGEIVGLMEDHGIKRVPIVEDGRVVGIVSRADLMNALGGFLVKPRPAGSPGDETIRRTVLAEMRKQPWCPVHSLTVKVRNGVVDLAGTIFDERQRRALAVLVENVEGVKGIRDRLKLPESTGEPAAPARDRA
jgi:CBS domain-containing protein